MNRTGSYYPEKCAKCGCFTPMTNGEVWVYSWPYQPWMALNPDEWMEYYHKDCLPPNLKRRHGDLLVLTAPESQQQEGK